MPSNDGGLEVAGDIAAGLAGAGATALGGPISGVVATAATRQAWNRVAGWVMARRERSAEEVIELAARAARLHPDDLLARLLADDERRELFVRTMVAAQDVGSVKKLVMLSMSLAAGATTSSAHDVKAETVLVRAIDDLDTPQLELLHRLSIPGSRLRRPGDEPGETFVIDTVRALMPELTEVADGLMASLESRGLVVREQRRIDDGSPGGKLNIAWTLSPFGWFAVRRLKEIGTVLEAPPLF